MHGVIDHISSTTCSTCGGPAPDWKCPGCGVTSKTFDPMHWRNCRTGMKMQSLCAGCTQAESKCTCGQPARTQDKPSRPQFKY